VVANPKCGLCSDELLGPGKSGGSLNLLEKELEAEEEGRLQEHLAERGFPELRDMYCEKCLHAAPYHERQTKWYHEERSRLYDIVTGFRYGLEIELDRAHGDWSADGKKVALPVEKLEKLLKLVTDEDIGFTTLQILRLSALEGAIESNAHRLFAELGPEAQRLDILRELYKSLAERDKQFPGYAGPLEDKDVVISKLVEEHRYDSGCD
jgi:hypothetical protein